MMLAGAEEDGWIERGVTYHWGAEGHGDEGQGGEEHDGEDDLGGLALVSKARRIWRGS